MGETMNRGVGVAAALIWALAVASVPQAAPQEPRRAAPAAAPAVKADAPTSRALVDRYCVSCHSDRTKTAGLSLQNLDLTRMPAQAGIWESVVRKVNAGMMPPPGLPRPSRPAADAFVSFLTADLDRAAAANPSPGRPLLHRLNRAEYANAVRDVLALEVDVTTLLPPDDSSAGFDNNADVLGVSPVLMERYLSAAMTLAAMAVGDTEVAPAETTFRPRADTVQAQHLDGLPLGTRGGLVIRETFPVNAEYVIKPTLWRNNAGRLRGMEHPHQLEILVDGRRVHSAIVGTPEDFKITFDDRANAAMMPELDRRLQVRVPITAGRHVIGVTFAAKTAAQEPLKLRPFLNQADGVDTYGIPKVDTVTIVGPYNVTGSGDTPSRRAIFTCGVAAAGAAGPAATLTPTQESACARTIVTRLARRAYRRTPTDNDLRMLMGFYDAGRKDGTFETGIQRALTRILTSTEFLFRIEQDPAGAPAGSVHPVSSVELASRLSFFLWSSVPDDTLLEVARQDRLRQPVVLAQQARRMLADPRAQALVSNFASQWLYLRNLRNVAPFVDEFPDFDDDLRQSFRRETEMLFDSVMRGDRPVTELLTADYTFVNERLARHYGIANIYGTHLRRVPVTKDERRGLLGHGSILTVTSNADRTSPVRRGKWILENVLGTPPPSPPDNVPPLKENSERETPLSIRGQMEEHRRNPACASCHKLMDPLGFALEQFDAVGAWRVRDAGGRIDASVELADGATISGPAALRRKILERPEVFVGTFTEKLLTYALGRGLTATDMPTVRAIVRGAAPQDYRFSSLILGVVKSAPFLMRAKPQAYVQPTSAGE